MLSLGIVDPDIAIGETLTLVWGEENGGSKKTTVERHKQLEIRVQVAAALLCKAGQGILSRGLAHRSAGMTCNLRGMRQPLVSLKLILRQDQEPILGP